MRALRSLLAEACAHDLLRPLAFDALAMALAFAALALLWIATPEAASDASPIPASAFLAPVADAGGSIGEAG